MCRFEQEAKAGFGDTPRKVEHEERTSPIPVLQMSLQEDNVEPPKPPGNSRSSLDSDVCRRRILMSKRDPRTYEIFIMTVDP